MNCLGFVSFDKVESARNAVEGLNGVRVENKKLSVSFKVKRPNV